MVIQRLYADAFYYLAHCVLQVKMPPMMEIITAEQLMEYLGEWSQINQLV